MLNCGAFTQVDRCDTKTDLAMRINGFVTFHLSEACYSL